MTINRVTQGMMMDRSYLSLQTGLSRLAKTQEQLSTGRVLNRPSDSPTDTTAAMRLRASLADQTQYSRNAEDGLGRLGQADVTLRSMLDQVGRIRELAVQSVNALNQSPAAREAIATEIEQLRSNLVDGANTTYLGRPVFGGLVNGSAAYDDAGTFVGVPGAVQRTIGKDIKVAVNPDAFGPNGASLFDTLTALADSVRAGTLPTTQTELAALDTARNRMTSALADVGTRTNRLERAGQAAKDAVFDLTSSLSEIENVDLARATMDLKMQEVAYQAALASTARLVQPSLADFLR
jgi:flagellar hook-associated protein 3 FlgL